VLIVCPYAHRHRSLTPNVFTEFAEALDQIKSEQKGPLKLYALANKLVSSNWQTEKKGNTEIVK